MSDTFVAGLALAALCLEAFVDLSVPSFPALAFPLAATPVFTAAVAFFFVGSLFESPLPLPFFLESSSPTPSTSEIDHESSSGFPWTCVWTAWSTNAL